MSYMHTIYDLCKECDHFIERGFTSEWEHIFDGSHHDPDARCAPRPRGTPKTLVEWQKERPDLFVEHVDGLIGPNSRYHVTQLPVLPAWHEFASERSEASQHDLMGSVSTILQNHIGQGEVTPAVLYRVQQDVVLGLRLPGWVTVSVTQDPAKTDHINVTISLSKDKVFDDSGKSVNLLPPQRTDG